MSRLLIVWLGLALLPACASTPSSQPPEETPSDATRHRAALATVVVTNATFTALTIAFRSATPPVQEIVIGRVDAGGRARLAPVPAGEPIILIARRADGSEFALPPKSLPLDVEWIWEIPQDATFTNRAK